MKVVSNITSGQRRSCHGYTLTSTTRRSTPNQEDVGMYSEGGSRRSGGDHVRGFPPRERRGRDGCVRGWDGVRLGELHGPMRPDTVHSLEVGGVTDRDRVADDDRRRHCRRRRLQRAGGAHLRRALHGSGAPAAGPRQRRLAEAWERRARCTCRCSCRLNQPGSTGLAATVGTTSRGHCVG